MEATLNTIGIEKVEIILKDGRWTVNGNKLEEMSHNQMEFMDSFFREVKILHPETKKRINFKQLMINNLIKTQN